MIAILNVAVLLLAAESAAAGAVQDVDRCSDGRLALVNAVEVAYADFSRNVLPVEHPKVKGAQSRFLSNPQNYEVRITSVAGGHEVRFFPLMLPGHGVKGGGGKYMVEFCSGASGGFSPFM
ncbi:hypothetical protein [Stenotrophomonas sp.]|uniref:hypothetical protein n=1 Tax=Stenotrophomonas sp. TaxID=69392 RepID=UPI002899B348|nr:hypothetical protein [Stenotrophomonas sp.]